MARRRAKAKTRPATNVRRSKALALLLEGRTLTEVSAELGIARRQLYRWRQDPDFAEELEARQDELRDAVHAGLVSMSGEFLAGLREVVTGRSAVGDEGHPEGYPVKIEMGRVNGLRLWAEMLGYHKGAPAAPTKRTNVVENEVDLEQVLDQVPARELEAALERKRAKVKKRATATQPPDAPAPRPLRKQPL